MGRQQHLRESLQLSFSDDFSCQIMCKVPALNGWSHGDVDVESRIRILWKYPAVHSSKRITPKTFIWLIWATVRGERTIWVDESKGHNYAPKHQMRYFNFSLGSWQWQCTYFMWCMQKNTHLKDVKSNDLECETICSLFDAVLRANVSEEAGASRTISQSYNHMWQRYWCWM